MALKLPTLSEVQKSKRTTSNLIRFNVHRNYIHAWATCIKAGASEPHLTDGILSVLTSNSSYSGLQNKKKTADLEMVGRMLRNSWTAEIAVRTAYSHPDDIRASISVPWGFVQIYYGLHDLFGLWIAIQGPENQIPKTHQSFRNQYANLVITRKCLPEPWSALYFGRTCAVKGLSIETEAAKIDARQWPKPGTEAHYVAKSLETTHNENSDQAWAERRGKSRITKKQCRAEATPTSIMDYLYRLRVGANYNDMDPYLTNVRDRQHIHEIREDIECIHFASMVVGEALLVKSIGFDHYNAVVRDFVKSVGATAAAQVASRRDALRSIVT